MSPFDAPYRCGIKVKLNVDLTKYHPSLKKGIEGITIPAVGMWARASDRFCGVKFPEVQLDVLWNSLKISDPSYLAEEEQLRSEDDEAIRTTATLVTKRVGPRGGFRWLSIQYTRKDGAPCSMSTGFKCEGERLEKILIEAGKKIIIERED